jgi:hypothetical protein
MVNNIQLQIVTVELKQKKHLMGEILTYSTQHSSRSGELTHALTLPVFKTITVQCNKFYIKDGALVILTFDQKKQKLIKSGYSMQYIKEWKEL